MSDGNSPVFTSLVCGLPATVPFVGPEAIERRRAKEFSVRVGANESLFGISPRAGQAMREALARVAWYGDPEGYDLRQAIAAHHGVAMDEVCLAGGIDELLGLTVRMLVEPGTPVLSSLGAYPTFDYHVGGYGGRLIRVPYRDDHIDLDALRCWNTSRLSCFSPIPITPWALGTRRMRCGRSSPIFPHRR